MKTLTASFSFLFLLCLSNVSTAHNLWLLVEPNDEGEDEIRLFFEHSPEPGTGEYNEPIAMRGRTWIRTQETAAPLAVNLEEVVRDGKKFHVGNTSTTSPRSVEHSCLWGVYGGRLDRFYGKYIDARTGEELNALARAERLSLDLVPQIADEQLEIQLLWQGEALPNRTIFVWTPEGEVLQIRTDQSGKAVAACDQEGLYFFTTVFFVDDVTGSFEGENFDGKMYGTTLTLRWPLEQ